LSLDVIKQGNKFVRPRSLDLGRSRHIVLEIAFKTFKYADEIDRKTYII